jgi:hypothetical protein
MQDRRLHTDEAFINHAWSEMRKQLDAEMPTMGDRRRHRFGWYWWLAMMGFLVLSVVTGYAIWNKKPAKPTTEVTKPIAVEATPMGNFNQAFLSSEQVVQNDLPEKAGNNVTPFNSGKSTQQDFRQRNQTTNQPVSSIQNSNALMNWEESQLPMATQETIKPVEALLGTTVEKAEEVVPLAVAVEPLEQLGTDYFPIANTTPSIAFIEPVNKNSRRIAIEAGYMHAIDNPALGMGLGLVVGKPLKNNKFNLQFGLGYNFVQQPLGVELAAYSFDGSGRLTEEVVFYGTESSKADEALIPSNAAVRTSRQTGLNLHYLSVPMRISCSITKRLSLKMGIDAAVLLRAKSEFVEGGVFERSDLSFQGLNYNAEISNDSNSSNKDIVAPFDLVSTVGIEYRIGNRLSLASQFRYGLVDVLPKNNTADYNRLLQLSLLYHLPNRK